MAKLTSQQIFKLMGKSGITKLNPATAIGSKAFQIGRDKAKESYGYDFVGLLIKIVVFFAVSYLAEIFIRGKIAVEEIVTGQISLGGKKGWFGGSSIGGMIFGYLYKSTTGEEYNWDPTATNDPTKFKPPEGKSQYTGREEDRPIGLSNFWSNEKVKQLFSEQGFHGLNYWSIIKIISILLVTAEFFSYLNSVKTDPTKKSSPFTIAIFTFIIIALGLNTIPDLIKRVKTTDFNLESMR
tara:strand:- start:716 stop:1432 length:717 start_codon:yes stop_codon:yes gene_type:complete